MLRVYESTDAHQVIKLCPIQFFFDEVGFVFERDGRIVAYVGDERWSSTADLWRPKVRQEAAGATA